MVDNYSVMIFLNRKEEEEEEEEGKRKLRECTELPHRRESDIGHALLERT